MRYAALLVHVEPRSEASRARVALAADLARRFDAALTGLAALAIRPPVVDAYGGAIVAGELIEAERAQIDADLAVAAEDFRADPALSGLEASFLHAVEAPGEVLARAARSADLVVVGRDPADPRDGAWRGVEPGALALAAGRPVLVVPPGTRAMRARGAVVAWKDTREARRAVLDALPLLAAAERVLVCEAIDHEDEREGAQTRVDAVAGFLRRHDVAAEGAVREIGAGHVLDALVLACEQERADLLVSGSYGHSRLREWVFGGVTADILRRCPLPCLLSH